MRRPGLSHVATCREHQALLIVGDRGHTIERRAALLGSHSALQHDDVSDWLLASPSRLAADRDVTLRGPSTRWDASSISMDSGSGMPILSPPQFVEHVS